ncbi:hypothetical protein HK405_015818, partial [Cladochytrium tenue]
MSSPTPAASSTARRSSVSRSTTAALLGGLANFRKDSAVPSSTDDSITHDDGGEGGRFPPTGTALPAGTDADVAISGPFPFTADDLSSLVVPHKDFERLVALGGLPGILQGLEVDPNLGLSGNERDSVVFDGSRAQLLSERPKSPTGVALRRK